MIYNVLHEYQYAMPYIAYHHSADTLCLFTTDMIQLFIYDLLSFN
jgi:hypothetical protein